MKFRGLTLSATQVKIIAAVTMLIDHISKVFHPFHLYIPLGYYSDCLLEGIGRIAFPIFAYFIAEGCLKTSNIKKYLFRLFVISIIAEPFYDFANSQFNYMRYSGQNFNTDNPVLAELTNHVTFWEGSIQNVCFTFFLSALAVYCWKNYRNRINSAQKPTTLATLFLALEWVSIYTVSLISQCEYWETAIPLVVLLHIIKARLKSKRICLAVLILWAIIEYLAVPQYGQIPLFNSPFISIWYTIFASLSCVALSKYDGTEGKKPFSKYFFYFFYPVHLFILGIIREIIIMV